MTLVEIIVIVLVVIFLLSVIGSAVFKKKSKINVMETAQAVLVVMLIQKL